MYTIFRYTFILVSFFLLIACKDSNQNALRQKAAGAPGDVLVVMNESYWNSEPGDTLKSILAAPVEALPSAEPLFNVIQIPHKAFARSFMAQRNIIVTKIGSDQKEPKITVQKDPYVLAQMVITIAAPSAEEFTTLIDTSRYKITGIINNTERNRIAEAYAKIPDPDINKTLADKYGISLSVPKAYDLDTESENFLWLAHEYRDIIQGVFVYFYDYTDPNTFTQEYLMEKRNEVLKENVPGEIPGSYMITEPLFPPLFYEYNLNGTYTAELRGLWRIEEGLAMGGPFVSVTQLDEKRNRVVTVEGFVFAPAHKKREYLRQVEAIALSLEILPEQKDN